MVNPALDQVAPEQVMAAWNSRIAVYCIQFGLVAHLNPLAARAFTGVLSGLNCVPSSNRTQQAWRSSAWLEATFVQCGLALKPISAAVSVLHMQGS